MSLAIFNVLFFEQQVPRELRVPWQEEDNWGIPVCYDGDPLVDFTPMRFLDRFVYRNPKTTDKKARKGDKNVFRRKAYDPLGVKKLAVTSAEYLSKTSDEIPADERFLHRFATLKPKVKKEVDKQSEGKEEDEHDFDDIESVNSEEFNVLLGKKTQLNLQKYQDGSCKGLLFRDVIFHADTTLRLPVLP
uniref:NUC153 domain-containing protein n=1 Tax=Ascaris lumbricoides TaxID=6252 RepID=A0A0M3IX51_ASCLU